MRKVNLDVFSLKINVVALVVLIAGNIYWNYYTASFSSNKM